MTPVIGATLVVAPGTHMRRMGRPQGSPLQRAMWEEAACTSPPTLWLHGCSNPIRLAEAIDWSAFAVLAARRW